MLPHQRPGHPLRRCLVLRGAVRHRAEQLRPVYRFRYRTVQPRQPHHTDDLPGARRDHRLMARVVLQGQLPGSVRLHQHIVHQGSQNFIGDPAVYQLPYGGAPGGADDTAFLKCFLQRRFRRIQHRGQVCVALEMGAGAQQYPSRQLICQGAQQGGFPAAADDGCYAFLNAQQGSELHLRHLLFVIVYPTGSPLSS